MKRSILPLLLFCAGVAQAFPGTLELTRRDSAVTRTLAVSQWRVDRRGVPSFEFRYRQAGAGCDYQRSGRATAGFEDNGDSVELEIYSGQDAGGREGAPLAIYYAHDSDVVFSMPVTGARPGWISFEDATMKKALPKRCGFGGRGAAIVFKQ